MRPNKEKAALQRETIIKLKAKDPTLQSSEIGARVGVHARTVERVLREQRTNTRRLHGGEVVPRPTFDECMRTLKLRKL